MTNLPTNEMILAAMHDFGLDELSPSELEGLYQHIEQQGAGDDPGIDWLDKETRYYLHGLVRSLVGDPAQAQVSVEAPEIALSASSPLRRPVTLRRWQVAAAALYGAVIGVLVVWLLVQSLS